jgi:hypothetical protein
MKRWHLLAALIVVLILCDFAAVIVGAFGVDIHWRRFW